MWPFQVLFHHSTHSVNSVGLSCMCIFSKDSEKKLATYERFACLGLDCKVCRPNLGFAGRQELAVVGSRRWVHIRLLLIHAVCLNFLLNEINLFFKTKKNKEKLQFVRTWNNYF